MATVSKLMMLPLLLLMMPIIILGTTTTPTTSALVPSDIIFCTEKTADKDCSPVLGDHFYCSVLNECRCKIFYKQEGGNGSCKSIGACTTDADCAYEHWVEEKLVACYDGRCSCASFLNDDYKFCSVSVVWMLVIYFAVILCCCGCIGGCLFAFYKSGRLTGGQIRPGKVLKEGNDSSANEAAGCGGGGSVLGGGCGKASAV